MLTQDRLKDLVIYDPTSGVFTHANDPSGLGCGSYDSDGYLQMRVDGKHYKLHRLVFLYMHGSFPEQVDHINHVRDDNRWTNLRGCDGFTNQKNRKMQSNNTSGVQGVNWHKGSGKWVATICVNKTPIHLGSFENKDDAIEARELANIKYGFHENHGIKMEDMNHG